MCAFAHQAWPLSLPSTHIYAEMLRTDVNDPDDELAAIVEEMESAPFGLYSISNVDRSGCTLKDFKNDTYFIPFEKDQYNPKEQYKMVKQCDYIFCGLYRFKGVWRVNGMSYWIDKTNKLSKHLIEYFRDDKLAFYNYTHNYVGLFDDFMARNGGNRLFFFKNINEQIKWSERNFGYQTLMSPPPEIKNRPVMGFIEPCGQMSLSTAVEYVKHPDNPYYNSDADKATLFTAFESESVSPDLALYMIEHDLWQDVGFNDMKGAEHGRLLFQDNIDFMVRCYRRDITRTDIYHRRNKDIFAGYSDEGNGSYSDYIDEFKGNDEFYSDRGLMSFSDFISELKERDEFYSRGNVKLWNLVSCTTKIIIVCDPANDKVHVISSEKLFKAYQELEEDQYKVANLVPYVGKNDASPATALLYSLTNGQINMRLLRQLSKLIMDSFK